MTYKIHIFKYTNAKYEERRMQDGKEGENYQNWHQSATSN